MCDRDDQPLGDLRGRVALQDQPGDVAARARSARRPTSAAGRSGPGGPARRSRRPGGRPPRPAARRAAPPRCPSATAPATPPPRPGSSGCSAVRSARPATASTDGRQPARRPSRRRAAPAASARPRGWSTRPPSPRRGRPGRARRALGVGGLADQQRPAGALGQGRRHRRRNAELGGVEHRLPGLAVEAERPPDLAGPGAQGGDQLLVAAERHVGVPARAAGRVAAGGLVQRRDPALGAGDVGELVDVVLVVLAQPATPAGTRRCPPGSGW